MSNITNYYIVLIFINLNEIHKLYIEYIIIQISFSPNKQQSLSKSQDRPAAASVRATPGDLARDPPHSNTPEQLILKRKLHETVNVILENSYPYKK